MDEMFAETMHTQKQKNARHCEEPPEGGDVAISCLILSEMQIGAIECTGRLPRRCAPRNDTDVGWLAAYTRKGLAKSGIWAKMMVEFLRGL